jgi:hypothetical protein
VAPLKYLETTESNQNSIQEENNKKFNLGNACYNSGPEPYVFLSAVYKHVKIIIYKTVILPLVLYGCENWS